METCKFFAEFCFYLHWSMIAIIFIGAYVQSYKKWTFITFWSVILGGIFSNAACGGCPFTICESLLREQCGQYIEFNGTFIGYYLGQWFGHNITPADVNGLFILQGTTAICIAYLTRKRWLPWFSGLRIKVLQFST